MIPTIATDLQGHSRVGAMHAKYAARGLASEMNRTHFPAAIVRHPTRQPSEAPKGGRFGRRHCCMHTFSTLL